MHFNFDPYISCIEYQAKVGIKLHALSLCFVSGLFQYFLCWSLNSY